MPTHASLTERRQSGQMHNGAQPADAPSRVILQRARRFGWLAVLMTIVLVVPLVQQSPEPVHWAELVLAVMAVILIAIYASYRSITLYVRSEQGREDALADAARRDGITLAANTVRHRMANKLAVAVGYSEMLADDPRLPAEVQEQANKVLTTAMAAAAVVRSFDRPLVRIELDTSVAGPPLLDVEASTDAT